MFKNNFMQREEHLEYDETFGDSQYTPEGRIMLEHFKSSSPLPSAPQSVMWESPTPATRRLTRIPAAFPQVSNVTTQLIK